MADRRLNDESDFDNGLVILEQIFNEEYPLTARRWVHCNLEQSEGETFYNWKARCHRSFIEAEMSTMTADDYHTFTFNQWYERM